MGHKNQPWAGYLLLAAALAAPILTGRGYLTDFLTMTFVWAAFATSLRIIMTVGLVSFAHAGFLAIGAYASAVLTMQLGLAYWLALPLSGLVTALVALGIGVLMLRTKGHYFFLSSFALGMAIVLTFSSQWRQIFGGAMGIGNIPRPTAAFTSVVPYYYLALGVLTVVLIFIYRLDRSRIALEWRAVREVDELGAILGINIVKVKLIAFVSSCFFAGMTGSVWAHYLRYISPDGFLFPTMLLCLTMVMVGGMYSTWGPLVGAFALRIVIIGVGGLREWEVFIYSGVLVICIVFLPEGIVGLPRVLRSRIGKGANR